MGNKFDMMHAHNHTEIAKHIWPDAGIQVWGLTPPECHIMLAKDGKMTKFNLLETDSDGNPTMQAKAHGDDVAKHFGFAVTDINGRNFVYVIEHEEFVLIYDGSFVTESRHAAIYKAACQVLGLEVSND